jgi:thiamine-phosphate pyrophosphorylase
VRDRDLLRQSAAPGVARVAVGGITPDNGSSAAEVRDAAQRFANLYIYEREPAR